MGNTRAKSCATNRTDACAHNANTAIAANVTAIATHTATTRANSRVATDDATCDLAHHRAATHRAARRTTDERRRANGGVSHTTWRDAACTVTRARNRCAHASARRCDPYRDDCVAHRNTRAHNHACRIE
jgi:hypothetical protein